MHLFLFAVKEQLPNFGGVTNKLICFFCVDFITNLRVFLTNFLGQQHVYDTTQTSEKGWY
jgi:hypothetical protein